VAVKLGDYARYDSPYAQAAFPANLIEVRHEGEWLRLDWSQGTREASCYL
jgi:hypothetical protein